jgi:hypothetical protein
MCLLRSGMDANPSRSRVARVEDQDEGASSSAKKAGRFVLHRATVSRSTSVTSRVGRTWPGAGLSAKLPQPGQPLEVPGARPHPKPSVASRREPPPGSRRRLAAVGGLQLLAVDHPPAAAGVGDEAGTRVPRAGGIRRLSRSAKGFVVPLLCRTSHATMDRPGLAEGRSAVRQVRQSDLWV